MDSEDRFIHLIKEIDDEIELERNRFYRFEASFRMNDMDGKIVSYDVVNVSICPHLIDGIHITLPKEKKYE